MRGWIQGAIAVALLAAGAGSYWYWSGKAPDAGGGQGGPAQGQGGGANRAAPVAVEATKVTIGAVMRRIEALGTTMSDESVIIRPEVTGRITQFHFREGERVARGALLVSLDDSIQAAQLEQAQAALALSRTNHERAVELFNRKAGTQRAVDEAVGAMRQDQARVRLQEAMLAKNQIRAPFPGVIGLRLASTGDYVNPGQAIVNLESIDTIKVDFRVPETNLATLAVGQKIEVRIDAFPAQTFTGDVFAIDPLVDRTGHAIVLRARIANTGGPLRPGMFARVTLIAESRDSVVLIPEQAIEPRGDDQFVYRVVEGRAMLTKIEVGQRRDAMVEVRQGLGRDDTIVTSGQIKLRDGAPVRIVQPSS